MKSNINEVWDLIDGLNPEEKKIIYKRMQNEIDSRLNNLLDKINERSEDKPVDFDTITNEVESVRSKNYGRN